MWLHIHAGIKLNHVIKRAPRYQYSLQAVTPDFLTDFDLLPNDNGLSPGRHQAIIWTSDAVMPPGTNFNDILIEIHNFSFKHDDVIKCKRVPCYSPFVRGIHLSLVNYPRKGQWRRALMFSLICAWINGWIPNRKAGDLRRHRARYDVIAMENPFQNVIWKMAAILSRPQCVNQFKLPEPNGRTQIILKVTDTVGKTLEKWHHETYAMKRRPSALWNAKSTRGQYDKQYTFNPN